MFVCWSKFKISEDLSEKEMIETFKGRFGKSLPLHSINMVLVKGLNDESEGKEESP